MMRVRGTALAFPRPRPRRFLISSTTGLMRRLPKARLAELGGIAFGGSAADFTKFIADETEKWAKVIRTAKIKPVTFRLANPFDVPRPRRRADRVADMDARLDWAARPFASRFRQEKCRRVFAAPRRHSHAEHDGIKRGRCRTQAASRMT